VVAADGTDDVPAVGPDGTNDGVAIDDDGANGMVAAATNGASDGGPAVVARDTRRDDAMDVSSSAALRTTRAPATGMPCMCAALSLSALTPGSRRVLVAGFRTKEF
jgi:hypothetical protein